MILRFGFENFRSFSDYQELLFTAAKSISKGGMNSLILSEISDKKVVPVTAIYGPNNSGKSNLLKALRFFHKCILHADGSKKKPSISKFKLMKEYLDKPSTFDMEFVTEGKHYNYGFKITDNKFEEEWLYEYSYQSRKSRRTLFERRNFKEFYYGSEFKGKNKTIASTIKDIDLFLPYSASRFEHPITQPIYDYILNSIRFRFGTDLREEAIAEALSKNQNSLRVVEFLESIDLEIVEIVIEKVKRDESTLEFSKKLVSFMAENLDAEIDIENLPEYERVIKIKKRNHDNDIVTFSLIDESMGTRALISILTEVFEVIDEGGVFIVDELESSLHPLVSNRILDIFYDREINSRGAQLIFTTHESSLLSHDDMRKDEIWLTDRNIYGETLVTPMLTYKINSKVNIRKGYLDGRFGGIPVIDKNFPEE